MLYATTDGAGVIRLDLNGQPPQPASTPTSEAATTATAPSPDMPTAIPASEPGICGGAAMIPMALLGLGWYRASRKRVGNEPLRDPDRRRPTFGSVSVCLHASIHTDCQSHAFVSNGLTLRFSAAYCHPE
ncbi:MAG: hypothetical protein HY781_03220 [Chloroflexi bacterium]|nr:hypothetical protein [Chloroflexota bacterium]